MLRRDVFMLRVCRGLVHVVLCCAVVLFVSVGSSSARSLCFCCLSFSFCPSTLSVSDLVRSLFLCFVLFVSILFSFFLFFVAGFASGAVYVFLDWTVLLCYFDYLFAVSGPFLVPFSLPSSLLCFFSFFFFFFLFFFFSSSCPFASAVES